MAANVEAAQTLGLSREEEVWRLGLGDLCRVITITNTTTRAVSHSFATRPGPKPHSSEVIFLTRKKEIA